MFRPPFRTVLSCVMVAGLLGGWAVRADEPAEIADLIRQLDAGKFNERQEASQRLTALGQAAIPALIEAARQGALEPSERAIEILKKHLAGQNAELKQAAKEALEKLTASDSPRVAGQAKRALQPPAPDKPEPAVPAFRGVQGFQIVPGGAQIQLRVQAIAGNQRRAMRINNGVTEHEVEEDGRKITIRDDPNNGLRLEVTEKKGGQETTKKYEAKNADELKKNHPEAYELYKKYSRQEEIQIQAVPALVPGAPVPLPVPGRAIPEGIRKKSTAIRLRAAEQMLESVQRQLDGLGVDVEAVKKARAKLDEARRDLETARNELEKADE